MAQVLATSVGIINCESPSTVGLTTHNFHSLMFHREGRPIPGLSACAPVVIKHREVIACMNHSHYVHLDFHFGKGCEYSLHRLANSCRSLSYCPVLVHEARSRLVQSHEIIQVAGIDVFAEEFIALLRCLRWHNLLSSSLP